MDQLSQHRQLDFGMDGQTGFTYPFISVWPDGGSTDQNATRPVRCQHQSTAIAVAAGAGQLSEVHRGGKVSMPIFAAVVSFILTDATGGSV